MNEIVKEPLLKRDKSIHKLHLKQPICNYSTCWLFIEHHEWIQKFKERVDLNYIYENKLDKTCFAHDSVSYYSKDIAKRTISDKVINHHICYKLL